MWLVLMAMATQAEAGRSCTLALIDKSEVHYRSAAELQTEEAARARVEARAPKPVPANGLVAVIVERNDIDSANGSNHIVVLESGGQVVLRYEAPPSVPALPNPPYDWRNIFEVPIPEGVQLPITVKAVDKRLQKACVWTVEAGGKVKSLPKEG